MKIIYRYLFQELITPFLFGVAAFTGIFVGTDLLFELTRLYVKWGVGLLTLVKLFFLKLPSIIVLSFPMAILLAIIMAFGRLSGDSEITALRTGGISIYKLILPALIIGLVMSGVTILINEVVVPRANYQYDQIVWEIQHGERMPSTQYNLYLTPIDPQTGRPDFILYCHRFDGETGVMQDVYLQDYKDGKPVTMIEAERAEWQEENWIFYNGVIYDLKVGARIPALKFNEYRAESVYHKPRQISQFNKDINDMNIRELSEYIRLKEEQGLEDYNARVKWHQRFSIPFACFIFSLLAAPLGIKPGRTGGSALGMGLSIIVIFIYYIIMIIGDALGSQGAIAPWLGAWIQNILFITVGSVMVYRLGK